MKRVRSQFLAPVVRLFGVRKATVGLAGVAGLGLLAALFVPMLVSADSKVNVRNIGTPRAPASAGGGFHATGQKGVVVNRNGTGGVPAGSVYMVDYNNNRIQQFDSAGNFARAWGRDVVWEGEHNSSVNEQQTVTVNATGGFFTLGVVTAAAAADYSSGSASVTVTPGFGTFRVGDTITQGAGLVGARIVGVSGNTLTLSTPATGSSAATFGTNIAATETVGATATGDLDGSTTVTNVVTSTGTFDVGQAISGTGIPAGTTITAVGSGTLTLSAAAAAGTGVALNSGIPYNAAAAAVQDFLSGLPGVGTNDITVSGGPGGTLAYTLTFAGGIYDGNDLANLATGATRLTGGAATAVVATPTTGGAFEVCQANATPADFCKQGTANQVGGTAAAAIQQAAGSFFFIAGIALDQDTGKVYVYDQTQRRVNVFSATGAFEGAFGWGVQNGAAALQFCTTITGCQAPAAAGAAAGQFAAGLNALEVNPVDGHVYVAAPGNRRVDEFAPSFTGNTVTGVSFQRAFGWDVVPGGATGLETCTATCQAGVAGNGAGQFTTGQPTAITLDSAGAIYTVESPACDVGTPCRVQRFNPSATTASDFAAGELTFTTGAVKANQLTVDPTNDHVHVAQTVGASQVQAKELDTDGTLLFTSPPGSPLPSAAATGIALDPDNELSYVSGSRVYVLGPVPPPTAEMVPPVTDVTATGAKFSGTVGVPSPGGPGFETRYRFEYSSDGINWTNLPDALVSLGNVAGTSPVTQTATGLKPNTGYSVRITACAGSCVTSDPLNFETDAVAPSVPLTFSQDITQTAATFGAQVNPNSSDTSYYFEWGTTTAYGNRVPATNRPIGDGGKRIIVTEAVSGLQPGAGYHFRVVARNFCHPTEPGDVTPSSVPCVTEGPDQTFETLNSCGLTDGRCYELVSPADVGAVGEPGHVVDISANLRGQVAADGSKAAYVLGYGLPDAPAGGEATYLATRGGTGWTSEYAGGALSSQVWIPNPLGVTTQVLHMSDDLSCGILQSSHLLTEDTPSETVELGGVNLFRRDASGNLTLMTKDVPEGLSGDSDAGADVIGASEDCSRVVFTSELKYPGVARSGLYEWDHGTLRSVGVVPGATETLNVMPGAGTFDYVDAVSSPAASRVFFSAVSQQGTNMGNRSVFMRENGTSTVDVGQSETGVINRGANYEVASRDGSRVFFTANYGLTTAASSGGDDAVCTVPDDPSNDRCDLYVYDVDTGDLVDLTATETAGTPRGAVVGGVLAADEDGSTVYFTAQGQLVPGKGNTYAENTASPRKLNVYRAHEASGGEWQLSFVGVVLAAEPTDSGLEASSGSFEKGTHYSSRTTPDGETLVFQTSANVTGYDSGGVFEVYRYSADSETTVCLSCRPDGLESVGDSFVKPLSGRFPQADSNYNNRPAALSEDGRRVFFVKPDVLASGAVEGGDNLYQWEDGQVSLIAARTTPEPASTMSFLLLGASADGNSVFFTTAARLSPYDGDDRVSIYVARVGGGFGDPPEPVVPCDPMTTGACQDDGLVSSPPVFATLFPASGNAVDAPRATFSIKMLNRAQRAELARGASVPVRVKVNGPGTLRLSGSGRIDGFTVRVLSLRRIFDKAGTARVSVRLSRPARRWIARKGSLRVTLTARFSGASKPTRLRLSLTRATAHRRATVPTNSHGKAGDR